MDPQNINGSSTLPRGFKYHHVEEPRTPESTPIDEPLVPRPARLKLKRRNLSSLAAPTQQFLASVAAADTPIPTIEVADAEMPDLEVHQNTAGFLSAQSHFRAGSPPKTPVPEAIESHQTSKFPDWSRDTPSPAPDYFGRPISSYSNASDCSEDSFYDGSRVSRPSASTCTSPDLESADPFLSPSFSKGKGRVTAREPIITLNEDTANLNADIFVLNKGLRTKTRSDARWTKAQSAHLWATYLQYLQDPTLTPFRFGPTCVPPEGVIHRVSRQAKRSWKGSRSVPTAGASHDATERAGSNTPTQETSFSYSAWPHSKSSTRNHLKELCRLRSTSAVHCYRHRQSRSTTPFTKVSRHESDIFATNDIALSLTTSISETMQPDGPLAKLAMEPISQISKSLESTPTLKSAFGEELKSPIPRLASPFAPQTYGPSSSNHLSTSNGQPFPSLRSPITFTHSRSLNSTQKRPAAYDLESELSSSGAVLRPSILNEQLFGAASERRRVRSRGFSLGDEVFRLRSKDMIRSPLADSFPIANEIAPPTPTPTSLHAPASLVEKFGPPPRLRSPFEPGPSNNTFPRRHFQENNVTVRRAPYATFHQSRRSIESFDFGPSLKTRLVHADSKLKEIHEREEAQRQAPQ